MLRKVNKPNDKSSPFFAVDYSLGTELCTRYIPSPETIHYSNLILLQDAVIMPQIFFFVFVSFLSSEF